MGLTAVFGKLSPQLYRIRIGSATILILAVPLLVYYLFYVRNQNAYFTERSFRSLSLMSQQIALKVESAGTVLKNSSERFINPQTETPDSPKFDSAKSDEENLKALGVIVRNLKDASPQIIPFSVQSKPAEGQAAGLITVGGVIEDEGTLWLYLNYQSNPTKDKKVILVKAKTNFNNLLQPLLARRENIGDAVGDEFQDLLIAEANGRVFFQLDPSEVRLASLDKVVTHSDQKKIDIKEVVQTSNVVDVDLAGSTFKLFFDPLELSLRPTAVPDGPNTFWVVCGLIRADRFRAGVWSVSYTWLILCAFITALVVLNWPFIKLVLIGPKDRVRPADIYFLTFSTVVVLAVLTSFGLYWYSYQKIDDQLDEQLGLLERRIKQNLNDELSKALAQLTILSSNQNLLKRLDDLAEGNPPETQNSPLGFYQQPDPDKNNILPELLRAQPHPYPYFDTAVWLDKAGIQKAKWTIKGSTTQYLDVSTRSYFRNLRLGNFQELNSVRFALEPIVSKTTGVNEVELSVLANDPNWITAFDTRLISLMQPVLPAGFGYLIIDKAGKVLFHSDEAHHLGENFFRECDDDPDLRSAVVARNGLPLNVRYLGQDHEVLVSSIEGFNEWSLVVFRNKQTLRSAFLELLSLVSLLFFVYSLILITAFSLFYLLNINNERRSWLWPSRKKTAVYYQSLAFLLLLIGLCIPPIIFLNGQTLVVIVAVISFLAILVFFVHLWRSLCGLLAAFFRTLLNKSNWFWRYDVAYVLNLSALLLLVAILPTVALFKFAFVSEMELFIKHGQFTLASALAKRNELIRNRYSEVVTSPNDLSSQSGARSGASTESQLGSQFVKERIGSVDWDIYDNFFFDTKRTGDVQVARQCPGGPAQERLLALTRFLPLYNQTSIERRGLLLNSATSGICRWEAGTSGELILHLDGPAARDVPWVHLSTPVPHLGIPGIQWMSLFLVAFIPFYIWLHFIVRKVYLLDVHRPTSYPLKSLMKEEFDRNLFIVLEAPFTERHTIVKENMRLLDVPLIAKTPDWASKIDYRELDAFDAIAIDHFDYKLTDVPTNQQKLQLLEMLLTKEKPIIVFSDVEPSQYQFSNGASETHGDFHDYGGRWAGIMSEFFKEYAEDIGDSKGFSELLKLEKHRILADLRGRSKEEIEELFGILYAECAHKLALQNIGRHILLQKSFITLSPGHLLNRILSQARTYYNDLWNSCSVDEKLTLYHLAQDRLLSHRDPDIEPLLRRGLIVRGDDVHLINDSFRQFVKSTEQIVSVCEYEEKVKRDSPWNTLKVPLLVILVGITIFLFVTQRDLYTSSLAVLTAVTTIIPAIFKVLSIFQSEPTTKSPNSS